MTNTNQRSGAGPQANEVLTQGGRMAAAVPGMRDRTLGQPPFLITTSQMAWASLTTRTRVFSIPFNFAVVDVYSNLVAKPTGSGATGKICVGTVTASEAIFTALSFTTGSTNGLTRQTTATNFAFSTTENGRSIYNGTAGQLLKLTALQTTKASPGGSVAVSVVIVPR